MNTLVSFREGQCVQYGAAKWQTATVLEIDEAHDRVLLQRPTGKQIWREIVNIRRVVEQ